MKTMRSRISGLYGITPVTADDAWLGERVEQALRGGMTMLQYRAKDAAAGLKRRQAERLLSLCRRYRVPMLINDDIELASAIGADGVHVGRDDVAPERARDALGDRAIVGVSCYADLDRLDHAQAAGADYVAFGSFHPSTVKPGAARAPLDLLRQARERSALPLVAIGGITPANAPELIACGAHALAVITALFHVPDTFAAACAFARCFEPCTSDCPSP
jgi:thiamine-phosphate pyrophosphorylase